MTELISTHHADKHREARTGLGLDIAILAPHSSFPSDRSAAIESSCDIPCLDFVNDVRSRHMPENRGFPSEPSGHLTRHTIRGLGFGLQKCLEPISKLRAGVD